VAFVQAHIGFVQIRDDDVLMHCWNADILVASMQAHTILLAAMCGDMPVLGKVYGHALAFLRVMAGLSIPSPKKERSGNSAHTAFRMR